MSVNKINQICYWLQKYGERGEDGFRISNSLVTLHLHYNYDESGDIIDPHLIYKRSDNFKMNAEYIDSSVSTEFLDRILDSLNEMINNDVQQP